MPNAMSRFLREERAALSIEAAIMLPLLAFFFVAGFGYFDVYRREAVLTKATYAMGDFLSREEGAVTPATLEGLHDVFEFLTFSEGETRMRFSEVRRSGDGIEIMWSYGTDGSQVLTPALLQGSLDRIPTLDDNERVMIVETFADFEPVFNIGLTARTFERFITTKQRYTGQLAFDNGTPSSVTPTSSDGGTTATTGGGRGNNGWGNGEDPAPGNSGPHNNAANGGGPPPPGQAKK